MRLKNYYRFSQWIKHDYHFIIKELEEEFKIQFACLGENTEKKPLQFQQENKLQELIKIK